MADFTGFAEIYRSPDGWRWRVVGKNGEIVAQSEAYTRRWSATRTVRRLWPALEVRRVVS